MRGHIYVLCFALLFCLVSSKPIDDTQSNNVEGAVPDTSGPAKRDDITETSESADEDDVKTNDQTDADDTSNASQVEEESSTTEEGAKKDKVAKTQSGKRRQYNGGYNYHPDAHYDDNVGYGPDGYGYGPNGVHVNAHPHNDYHAPYSDFNGPHGIYGGPRNAYGGPHNIYGGLHNGIANPHAGYVGGVVSPHRGYGYPVYHGAYGTGSHGGHRGEHGHHKEGHQGQGHENHDHGFEFYEEWGEEGGHQHGTHGHEDVAHHGVHAGNGYGPAGVLNGHGYNGHPGYGGAYDDSLGGYGGGYDGGQHGHEGHGHEEGHHGHHAGFKHEWGHHEGGHEGESEHVGGGRGYGEHAYGEHGYGGHGYPGNGWTKSYVMSDGSPKVVWGELGEIRASKTSEGSKAKSKSAKATKKWYTSNGGHFTQPGVSHWGPPVLGDDNGGWHFPENGLNGGYGVNFGGAHHITAPAGHYTDVVNAPDHRLGSHGYGAGHPGFIHVGYGTHGGHLNAHPGYNFHGLNGPYPGHGAHHINLNEGIGDGLSYTTGHPLAHRLHHHSLRGPWNFGTDRYGDDFADWDHNHGNYHHLNGIGIFLPVRINTRAGFTHFSPFSKSSLFFPNGIVNYVKDNVQNRYAIGLPIRQQNSYDITLTTQPTHATRKTLHIHCDLVCKKPGDKCVCKKDNTEAALLDHMIDENSLPPSQSILPFETHQEHDFKEIPARERSRKTRTEKKDRNDLSSWWNDFKFNAFPQPFYTYEHDQWSKKSMKKSKLFTVSEKRHLSKKIRHLKKKIHHQHQRPLLLKHFISPPISQNAVLNLPYFLTSNIKPFSFFTFVRFQHH